MAPDLQFQYLLNKIIVKCGFFFEWLFFVQPATLSLPQGLKKLNHLQSFKKRLVHVQTHPCMYIFMYLACTHVCIYFCMQHTHTLFWMCLFNTYTCMYMYVYTHTLENDIPAASQFNLFTNFATFSLCF